MIRVSNITKSFGRKEVLRGVSFDIAQSAMVGLIGPSGAGKSILLKILARVVRPHDGSVELDAVQGESVSLMFQEGALFDSLNVIDNVAFPLVQGRVPTFTLARRKQKEVHEKVAAILERVGLLKAAYKMPAQLSGGMRRRVSLARALVARPNLVLLDDPTCGLDPVASSVIVELIREMHKEYQPTVLVVSHDLRRLVPMVDSMLALFDGRICFSGTLPELERSNDSALRHFVSCRYDLSKMVQAN